MGFGVFFAMRGGFVIVAALAVVVAAVYGQSLEHQFIIWDDDQNIYKNPHLSSESLEELGAFWKGSYLGLYIPLVYTIWGAIALVSREVMMSELSSAPVVDGFWFHFANVGIHFGSTVLVFALIYRLLGRRDMVAAALGASLFALHPLQVEPVAWATGMKDLLSTFLALVAALLFFRHRELMRGERKRRAVVFYGLALGAFVLSLLAKPSLVVLPVCLAVMEIFVGGIDWKGGEASMGKMLFGDVRSPGIRLLPFVAVAAVFVGVTMRAQGDFEEVLFPFDPPPLWQRPVVALDCIGFYAVKLIYPFHLAPEYGRDPDWALGFAGKYPFWLLPLLAAGAVWRVREHRAYYFTAIGIALVGVVPVLGLVPFGYQGQSSVADRYMYLSMFGVGLGLATWLSFAKTRRGRYGGAAMAIGFLAVISFAQVEKWQCSTTLFRHCLKVNPESVSAAYNYALASSNAGQKEEAMRYYRKVIGLKKDFDRAYTNLGKILNDRGRSAEALPFLETAVRVNPRSKNALNNLGIAHGNLGHVDEEIAAFERVLEWHSDSWEALLNLGMALIKVDRDEEAMESFERGSMLRPGEWRNYYGMGLIHRKRGDSEAAVRAYEAMVRRDPSDIENQRILAKAYARVGEFEAAAEVMARAVELARERIGMTEEMREVMVGELDGYLRGE